MGLLRVVAKLIFGVEGERVSGDGEAGGVERCKSYG